jgi:hypothetical protein
MNDKRQKIGRRAAVAAISVLLVSRVGAQASETNSLSELKRQLDVVGRKLELIQEEGVAKVKEAATRFEVAVYGRVKFDAAYDTGRTSPGDWALYALPQTPEEDNELNATARDSRLGVRLRAPNHKGLVTTGLIETDFLSTGPANSPNPRLRLAYFDVANPEGWALRLGQDWDLFGVYHPNSLDAGLLGNTGNPRGFRPQARVSKTIKVSDDTKWVASAALTRNIGQDLDGAGQDDGANTGAPAGQAGLALHTKGAAGRPLTLAVSGLYGTETVDAVSKGSTTSKVGVVSETVKVTATDDQDYDSWLAHVAVVVPLSAKLAIQGVVWTGANLDAYQAGIGQGVNTTAKTEIGAKGGYLQLTANATEKLTLGVGYGVDDPDDGDLAKAARTLNSRVYGNAVYALTPAASVGVEVSQIETEYKEQASSDAQRLAFSGTLRF